jgi:hypothetical protein
VKGELQVSGREAGVCVFRPDDETVSTEGMRKSRVRERTEGLRRQVLSVNLNDHERSLGESSYGEEWIKTLRWDLRDISEPASDGQHIGRSKSSYNDFFSLLL